MRPIDADALINELNNSHYPGAPYVDAGISIAIGKVCDAHTIDPVRKGHKINQHSYPAKWLCSECGAKHFDFSDKFCSECGVNVEEGEEL